MPAVLTQLSQQMEASEAAVLSSRVKESQVQVSIIRLPSYSVQNDFGPQGCQFLQPSTH